MRMGCRRRLRSGPGAALPCAISTDVERHQRSLSALRQQHELSLVRRALQQLVRATSVGQAGARPRPGGSCPRGADAAARGSPAGTNRGCAGLHPREALGDARSREALGGLRAASGPGRPTRRRGEQAPERDGGGRRVPLDPPTPALSPARDRAGVAEDTSSAAAERSEGANRQRAAEPVEHHVHTLPPVSSRTRARKSSLR